MIESCELSATFACPLRLKGIWKVHFNAASILASSRHENGGLSRRKRTLEFPDYKRHVGWRWKGGGTGSTEEHAKDAMNYARLYCHHRKRRAKQFWGTKPKLAFLAVGDERDDPSAIRVADGEREQRC